MDEVEQVSALIGDIYDASLDPALWCPVLQQIGDFVGGPTAALFAKDDGPQERLRFLPWPIRLLPTPLNM